MDLKLSEACIIPFDRAVLCEDCNAVTNGVLACPACGSHAIANIGPWLRERDPKPAPSVEECEAIFLCG